MDDLCALNAERKDKGRKECRCALSDWRQAAKKDEVERENERTGKEWKGGGGGGGAMGWRGSLEARDG